jgi:alpha-amylase
MRNICFTFQMHAPYRLKRYRFFDIGQDHYYFDDLQTEDQIVWLAQNSYLPLVNTLNEMIKMSRGKFRCGIAVSGVLLELLQQFAPEVIDAMKELATSKAVEFVATPYAYSFASEYSETEFEHQLKREADIIQQLFDQKPTTFWNTELLYDDSLAAHIAKLGYKAVMTEGAKHLLSWKSPNYVYQSVAGKSLKVLLRNAALSDELSFHFSDPKWHNFPIDAEKYAAQIASIDGEEPVINLWMGADTFGIRQNAGSGIFEFLKALPFYMIEREIGFLTPGEAAKKIPASDVLSSPYPTTWCGESKDLAAFNGNDLQQEALQKLYAVAERVRMCKDIALRRDWYVLQSDDHFLFMNHIDPGHTHYESAYAAFINYMNVLSDFLLRVEEQYPTTIENEELNALLKTINNQEKEIAHLEAELKAARKHAPKAEEVKAKKVEVKAKKEAVKAKVEAKKAEVKKAASKKAEVKKAAEKKVTKKKA